MLLFFNKLGQVVSLTQCHVRLQFRYFGLVATVGEFNPSIYR